MIAKPVPEHAPPALDPLDFPMAGSQLIEASAGTGKTWTIAALYLRLILGHGTPPVTARLPSEILVLTFTEAASQELRARIRDRLAEAARFFAAAEDVDSGPDPFLGDLRAAYEPAAWPACARRLDLAAQSMDEAAISTIHAWCARMLQEHAFDSGSLFTQNLEPDLEALEQEAVWDYWRTFCAVLDLDDATLLRSWWKGPSALVGTLRAALTRSPDPEPGAVGPAVLMAQAREQAREILQDLKASWREWVVQLSDFLDSQNTSSKIRAHDQRRWLAALRDWIEDPDAQTLDLKTGWDRLSVEGIQEAWKGDGPAPYDPVLERVTELRTALDNLPDGYPEVWAHALSWCAQRLRQSLAQRALMGFDGLLMHLDRALQGSDGERLARVLRAQYPVAMIDEFQDTDPIQYHIFDQIYQIASNRQDLCLVLIGDPKQSIYGFRGADIHAYLRARAACATRLHTLARNFRSAANMVEAVNACFGRAESGQAEGAFLSAGAEADRVPFFPVAAQGRDTEWVMDDTPQAALSIHEVQAGDDDDELTVSQYEQGAAQWCAAQIVHLLNLGAQGRAGFRGKAEFQPARPADIAVLVNSRKEAGVLRAALASRRVRSVYLSERESVYGSAEAGELGYWLAACAQPTDGRALRAALAGPAMGMSWADIEHINTDEQAWEALVLRFHAYKEYWRSRGVLPMLRRLLNDFGIPTRLLGADGQGERALTNILHVAELLQRASAGIEGEQGLMRYLDEQRQDAASGAAGSGDARQVRLESDADLVRVVTVHKSKGLEYPLVFLPFASKARPTSARDVPLVLSDEHGDRVRVFNPTGEQVAQADVQRLAEDIRKLYVALTRARHAVWMAVGDVKNNSQFSATAYVLGGTDGVMQTVQDLAAAHQSICVSESTNNEGEVFHSQAPDVQLGAARVPVRSARDHWWISSYSALKMDETDRAWAADTAAEDVFIEERGQEVPSADGDEGQDALPGQSLHDFPKGSEAGTFLHGLLEWAAGVGFAQIKDHPEVLRDMVARRCAVRGWEQWIDLLCEWLPGYVGARLVPDEAVSPALSLASVPEYLAEMEFWLPADGVAVEQLDALVRRHTFDGAARPRLGGAPLRGMFKGFIDLALCHGGRYYIVDYKSNWLGQGAASYTPEAMRDAMLGARYDMQYVLYVLALHRQLKARLDGYDYARHMGGAMYFFLRGLDAPGQGVFADRPSYELIESLDRLFAGPGDKGAHHA
ncbi:MAG: exodeoxyribonuclease V subunit beta [Alcaligenaceae bacterium]|nr:exodeoxyribonuclease V subunit beta [Alcaligenaceae bacterium]